MRDGPKAEVKRSRPSRPAGADEARSPAITDEAIAAMRADLHRPWECHGWNSRASFDAIWHFAHGVGDDNPLWWDEAYAAGTRSGRMFAPPMFLYSCANAPLVPGVFETAERGVDSWLPGALGLWAQDRWVWHDRLWLDEPVRATAELWDVKERRSSFAGRSISQTTRIAYRAGDDRLVGELFRTIFRFERSALSQTTYMDTPRPRYSSAERTAIREQYLRERPARRGADVRYGGDVKPGDPLPTLLKGPLDVTSIAAWVMGWGSPMCQSNRLRAEFVEQRSGAEMVHPVWGHADTIEGPHWDDDLARLGGFPRGYDFGPQRFAWMLHCVSDWCGDDAVIRDFEGRLRRPNLVGDLTTITGVVAEKSEDAGSGLVTCSLEARNQRDELTATARATVELAVR